MAKLRQAAAAGKLDPKIRTIDLVSLVRAGYFDARRWEITPAGRVALAAESK